MPFVIDTDAKGPRKYDRHEWCELQESFNRKTRRVIS